jgi:hypothetical protein
MCNEPGWRAGFPYIRRRRHDQQGKIERFFRILDGSTGQCPACTWPHWKKGSLSIILIENQSLRESTGRSRCQSHRAARFRLSGKFPVLDVASPPTPFLSIRSCVWGSPLSSSSFLSPPSTAARSTGKSSSPSSRREALRRSFCDDCSSWREACPFSVSLSAFSSCSFERETGRVVRAREARTESGTRSSRGCIAWAWSRLRLVVETLPSAYLDEGKELPPRLGTAEAMARFDAHYAAEMPPLLDG